MSCFHDTALTHLALGEAVPYRQEVSRFFGKAYKRSKGTNDVAYTALALQKINNPFYKISKDVFENLCFGAYGGLQPKYPYCR